VAPHPVRDRGVARAAERGGALTISKRVSPHGYSGPAVAERSAVVVMSNSRGLQSFRKQLHV
jgi:hypothetical protein